MKYRALRDVESQNWKQGDVISIIGDFSEKSILGVLEQVPEETQNQHVLVVADVALLGSRVNQ